MDPTIQESDQTLPCLVCRKPLANACPGVENQPRGGLEFTTSGHYGSTAFDPMNGEQLTINICDDCLCEASKHGAVGHTDHPKNKITCWRPDSR